MMAPVLRLVGLANAKVNAVVRVVLFVFTSLLQRWRKKTDVAAKVSIQAEYDSHVEYPFTLLRMYDTLIRWNNFSCWNVSIHDIQAFYDANVSSTHLDVGVGSGYLPSHSKRLETLCKLGEGAAVHLWDINKPPIVFASQRLTMRVGPSLSVTTRQVDICDQTLAVDQTHVQFETVAMFYLFNCIPYPDLGADASNEDRAVEKFRIGFESVKAVMAPGAIVSGTTIVCCNDPAIPVSYSPLRLALARGVMDDYQHKLGHFFNQHDTLGAIEKGATKAGLQHKATFLKGLVAHFVFEKGRVES